MKKQLWIGISSLLMTIAFSTFCYAQNTQDSALFKELAGSGAAISDTIIGSSHQVYDALVEQDDIQQQIDVYYRSKVMKSPEFVICIMLLVFAIIICIAEIAMFIRGVLDSFQVTKLLVVTLIIFSLLFLITAGFSNEQISPAVGLLGTIAGYLLGRSPSSISSRNSSAGRTDQVSIDSK